MPNVRSLPRLALLSSPRPGSDALTGPVGIASQPVDPRYADSYDETDRRVGLALFDNTFRREALAALSASLAPRELPVHAPERGVAALAS
jgi:hypothetical protein